MQYSKITEVDQANLSEASNYRRTTTGEIDYYHYIELGRRERAAAAGYLFSTLRSAVATLFAGKEPSGHPIN